MKYRIRKTWKSRIKALRAAAAGRAEITLNKDKTYTVQILESGRPGQIYRNRVFVDRLIDVYGFEIISEESG